MCLAGSGTLVCAQFLQIKVIRDDILAFFCGGDSTVQGDNAPD